MPKKTFTDKWVANIQLKSGERQTVYFDTKERLVLVVGLNAKTFRLLTYTNGKGKTIKLGRYPDLSLKDARQKARDFADDPQKFAAQSFPDSFKKVADNWVKRHVDANGLRSKREIERILNKYIFPAWGERKFLDIRRGEVNQLLDHVSDKHGRSQADSVLKVVRSICNFQATRLDHYVSPIVKGMKRSKPEDSKDLRFLDDDEIRLVWEASNQLGTFGRLVKFALLTAQRRGKLGSNNAAMKWSDISKDGVWTIRAEKGEKGTVAKIKLPTLVLDILNEQPRIAGNPYVFANTGSGPFNAFSDGMSELRDVLPYDMPSFSMHDLRRTSRKLMSRAGIRPDVAELAIGHSLQGLQKIYDDVLEYQGMIDHAFECVAAEVDKILNPPPRECCVVAQVNETPDSDTGGTELLRPVTGQGLSSPPG